MSLFGGVGSTRAPMNLCVGGEVSRELLRGCVSSLRPAHDPGVHNVQPVASGSGRHYQALASLETQLPRNNSNSNSRGKLIVEKLWRDFFSDPSQWWDHRAEKECPRYPDFRHKESSAGLWLNDNLNPSWVEAGMATIAPSDLQEHVFSWNRRLARYVKDGQYVKALDQFNQMELEGIFPNNVTFSAVVKACARLQDLKGGKYIHSQILQRGYGSDLYLSSGLVDMYARCGSIQDAQRIFDEMSTRDVVSWNAIILGHAKCGQGRTALELSRKMQEEGIDPDPVTYVGILNACASMAALEEGRQVHEEIIQLGWDSRDFIGSSLINMYAACGRVDDARRAFDKISGRDVASWNAMIQGYLKCGQGQKALDLNVKMQLEGLQPNSATFVGLLNSCASVGNLAEGRHLHEQVVRRGLDTEAIMCTSLIHMYSACGSIKNAWRVFNRMPSCPVMSWNAMIEGFVKCKQEQHALALYWAMMRANVEPDSNTFVAALNSCASVGKRSSGRRIHESIARRGLESLPSVGAGLIRMYAGCRRYDDARTIFNDLPLRDLGCWNAMLEGYVKCGQWQKALELYGTMQLENVEPDVGTFVEVLNACGMVGALDEGKAVHAQICARGLESDRSVSRGLSRMYAKCERIIMEQTVYSKLPKHDQVSLLSVVQQMTDVEVSSQNDRDCSGGYLPVTVPSQNLCKELVHTDRSHLDSVTRNASFT
ncbi:unnamed protein product [Calypogeia fissa]